MSAQESALLAQDRLVFPKKMTTHRGEPQWEGSSAQTLLHQDVKDGNHLALQPYAFQQTRQEYLLFSLSTFRGHIYQEEKLQKWLAHCRKKEKDKYNRPKTP